MSVPAMHIATVAEAVFGAIQNNRTPIVTTYEINLEIIRAHFAHSHLSGKKNIKKSLSNSADFNKVVRLLEQKLGLLPDRDFSSGVYRIHDTPDGSPEELCCAVDPFCYLSHLSALEWRGFTNRRPAHLILTTPDAASWRRLATQKVAHDLEFLPAEENWSVALRLPRYRLPVKVRGRATRVHVSKFHAPGVLMRSPNARISAIGQTFVETLLEPAECGGMPHVVEIWLDHAEQYLDEIIAAVNRTDSPLAKVRAGYLIEERLGKSDPRIQEWTRFAQRGGSRKLDPSKPYRPKYSEKWQLSINF
jgi:predicted transcriptional regulator of viral defense system